EPLLYRANPERSLFADIARGEWGRIARLMAAGLFAGVLWESFNAASRAKWIYTVPFVAHVKLSQMPPIGFLGFPFFALEVWSLYHVLASRTSARTVLSSVLFAGLVLVGVDHWTVSSVSPGLADLPGISAAVRTRLRDAGWTDVFRLARAPAAEVAYRARITPDEALAARQAARLSTLRGIGTRHAAALMAGGVSSVEALARADPDSLWRGLASIATTVVQAHAQPAQAAPEAVQLDAVRQATLGEYEILGELGRGGMASVYLAHDIALDRRVAIKVMAPALLAGEGMAERFKREARTAASLSHPNIIPIYAVRETEHALFFVMKLIEGRPLDSIIHEIGPLPIPMVQA